MAFFQNKKDAPENGLPSVPAPEGAEAEKPAEAAKPAEILP
jgi:hypothetical protein